MISALFPSSPLVRCLPASFPQQEAPPDPKITAEERDATLENERSETATSPAGTQTSGELEPDLPVSSFFYILGYSVLSVLLAICGLVVWAVATVLTVCSRMVATVWKWLSLFHEARRVNTYPGRPHGVANGAPGDLHGNPRGGAVWSCHFCSECHGFKLLNGEWGRVLRQDTMTKFTGYSQHARIRVVSAPFPPSPLLRRLPAPYSFTGYIITRRKNYNRRRGRHTGSRSP